MQVKVHELPDRRAMVGGLAYDAVHQCVWLGLGNSHDFVTRFDLSTSAFLAESVGAQLEGWSYVHRSLVPMLDGRLYLGASWVFGAKPRPEKPGPLSPGGFGAVLGLVRWMGGLLSKCKVMVRETDGTWKPFAEARTMAADLAWDAVRRRLLRLSARGVTAFSEDGKTEELVAASPGGFSHGLALGPAGELVLVDGQGVAYLQDVKGGRIKLGSLADDDATARATPGIDALVRVGDHFLVGGTRNRVRPFVIDLRVPALRVLPPVQTGPRASAFAVSQSGKVYFAAGVGNVGLYRLDPEQGSVDALGQVTANGVACHHLHDLVVTADGRLFGGEFYPLDVPQPPWPERDCYLWEMGPVPV